MEGGQKGCASGHDPTIHARARTHSHTLLQPPHPPHPIRPTHNSASVEGDGKSSCDVQADCANLKMPGKAKLAAAPDEDDDEAPLKYDNHHLLLATITTTTEAGVPALDLPELQEAVVAAVAEVQGASQDKDSVIVSASKWTGWEEAWVNERMNE